MTTRGPCLAAAALAALLVSTGCGSAASPAVVSSAATAAEGGSMAQLQAAAQKEGQVNWAVTSSFANGIDGMRDIVKTKYGVDLKINATANSDYVSLAAKAIQEVQASAPATYDLVDQSDSTLSPWATSRAARAIDWKQYVPGLPEQAVVKGVMLVNYNSFLVAAAFNPKVIPKDQAPKSYDDLLDPKWKGKIAVHNTATNWTWLAQPGLWGEAKLIEYLRKLIPNTGMRGTYADRVARVLSGEYPIAASLTSNFVWEAQKRGQPMDGVPTPPTRDGRYGSIVPSNAQHPNAAILLSLALVTQEAQDLRDKVSSSSAAWVPGTSSAKFVAENAPVPVDIDFQEANQDRLVKIIDPILRGA